MITLAHISDVHLGPLPHVRPGELLSKRLTGYLNWTFNRGRHMHRDTLGGLVDHMKAKKPDFVAVTGDLMNLAADSEVDMAGEWLEKLGPPQTTCAIPGNHDAYVKGALEKAQKRWGPYMRGATLDGEPFPFVRKLGNVAIIACSSGVPQPPFIAKGHIGTGQTERLARCLKTLGDEGFFRVILIHHPPSHEFAKSRSMGLSGAVGFRDAVREHGAELILHGHLHHATVTAIDGPDGEVPVIGVAAASSDAQQGEQPARYNLFSIERLATKWSCKLKEYGYQRIGSDIVMRLQMRIY